MTSLSQPTNPSAVSTPRTLPDSTRIPVIGVSSRIVTPPFLAEELVTLIAGARLLRLPGAGHGALWEAMMGEPFQPPADKPLTLAAYESDSIVTAYVEPIAIGDSLPDMPLFLEPGAYVDVPLDATYGAAFLAVPERWRTVIERE